MAVWAYISKTMLTLDQIVALTGHNQQQQKPHVDCIVWHISIQCSQKVRFITRSAQTWCYQTYFHLSLVPEGGPVCMKCPLSLSAFLRSRHPVDLRYTRWTCRFLGHFSKSGSKVVPPPSLSGTYQITITDPPVGYDQSSFRGLYSKMAHGAG